MRWRRFLWRFFPYFFSMTILRPFVKPGILRGLDLSCPANYVVAPLKTGCYRAWGFVYSSGPHHPISTIDIS